MNDRVWGAIPAPAALAKEASPAVHGPVVDGFLFLSIAAPDAHRYPVEGRWQTASEGKVVQVHLTFLLSNPIETEEDPKRRRQDD